MHDVNRRFQGDVTSTCMTLDVIQVNIFSSLCLPCVCLLEIGKITNFRFNVCQMINCMYLSSNVLFGVYRHHLKNTFKMCHMRTNKEMWNSVQNQ